MNFAFMKNTMKTKILLGATLALFSSKIFAQGPGLIISEILPNPAGTDSPFEYVELVATKTIDFSLTPYSVVVCNNGTATTNGWINGGTISYGFDITTGIVNQGDVVYVGGNSMSPTGTKLRVINTGTTNGDGFGNFATGGVFGNGGGNCDGIAVFNLPTSSLSPNTIPQDALFYGTSAGTAVVTGGTNGYQLPFNDIYSGGKLQTTSFLAPDPASGQAIEVISGTFNPTTGSFTTGRSFSLTAGTDLTSNITFSTAIGNVNAAMATTHQTVNENGVTASFNVTITNANTAQAVFQVNASTLSTAEIINDYSLSTTIVVPAGSTTTQTVTVSLNDDALNESDEYVIFSLQGLSNATAIGSNIHTLYIKDNDNAAPVGTNQIMLNLLGSYSNGTEGLNSAEIVAFDSSTNRLFIANSIGAKIDIVDFSNPSSLAPIASVNVTPYGNINSVAVYNGLVAAAIENSVNPQDSGKVVFFDANGTFLNSVKVGAMPDMITFNHAGNKVLVACEGEPNASYTVDPEGRICIVNLTVPVASLTQSNVDFINFTSFIGQETTLRASGIRIYGPGSNAAQDFEPEYITVSDDDQTAWVTLQENNAIAKIDLLSNTITQLMPLGFKNHLLPQNALDASDQTSAVNLSNFPILGMYLPDAIANFSVGANKYIITANEGDARAYAGFNEESRISGLTLDPTAYPNASQLKANTVAGRLLSSNKMGDTDNDGDIDQIYTLGGRSFSIWDASTGALVYDSGNDFEKITSTHPVFGAMFNASNGSGAITVKNRSDDKGPEPEGTTVATIDGNHYAFISLERIGGVMIYNINNPASPVFSGYYNNRNVATNGPDRGAEGMIYIDATSSPNGMPIVILANEISSTLTVYQINTCRALSNATLLTNNNDTLCFGDTTLLYSNLQSGVNYQWYLNDSPISGATDTSFSVSATGNYSLGIVNTALSCVDTLNLNVLVHPSFNAIANASQTTICSNDTLVLYGSGATSYTWNNGVTDNLGFVPTSSGAFVLTGHDNNGCSDTNSIFITVNAAPLVIGSATDTTVCLGSSTILSGAGANSYSWSGGISNGVSFSPSTTTTYVVTGTDLAGCSNQDTVEIMVIDLNVGAIATFSEVCSGNSTALNGTGASTYSWSDGVNNGFGFVPSSSQYYVVTGTDAYGCIDSDSIFIEVLPLPNPTITYSSGTLSIPTYSSMQWFLNGSPIPGATSAIYAPSTDGDYTVQVTDANGCSGTSSVFTLNTTGLNALSNLLSAKIYPNPANTKVIVELPATSEGKINLMNSFGQLMMSAPLQQINEINLNEFANGYYTIQIVTATQTKNFPLLKN